MRFVVFILASMVAFSTPAVGITVAIEPAGVIPRDTKAFLCVSESEYLLLADSEYRRSVAALHPLHSRQDMLRICNDAFSNHHYFLRDIIRSGGICRLSEAEIFPIYSEIVSAGGSATAPLPRMHITSWTNAPPKEWSDKGFAPQSTSFAYETASPCPRADSPSYVPAAEHKP